jgi:DNA-directed RNA polymerase specialized sigma24 family protein
MGNDATLKKDWVVTPDAFEKMLRWLDTDLSVAGEKYEKIREKLVKLFRWRNCFPEEEYADVTINRVTRRIYESAEVNVENPYTYFHGTALNVLREYWRGRQRHKHEDIDSADQTILSVGDAEDEMIAGEESRADERRYGCMRECLNELPDDGRDFIVKYHHGENKKESRKLLAQKMGLELNVLRIRACRLRDTLQGCVGKCLRRSLQKT